MMIDRNIRIEMTVKPFFPIGQFMEWLMLVVKGVNHGLPASLSGRVEGVERVTTRSRKGVFQSMLITTAK